MVSPWEPPPSFPHSFIMLMLSGLPVDLQYLPEDKRREEDPDIRKMVLETLLLVHKLSLLPGQRKTFRMMTVSFSGAADSNKVWPEDS